MRKIFLVMKQELFTTFSRPSYLLFAFGLPVIALVILGVTKLIQNRNSQDTSTQTNVTNHYQIENEGFVDYSGLIQTIPDDLQDYLFAYETEIEAQQALESAEISAYYLVPADYVKNGEVQYVYPNEQSFLADRQPWVIRWTLTLNLMDGNLALADQIWNPIWDIETHQMTPNLPDVTPSGEDCSRPGAACESYELIRMIPSLLVVIFFIAFMSSSSMLFNSIGVEKENRTIELLLLSLNSRQLLAGKTLALGIAGLSQTLVWLLAIYFSFNLGGQTLRLPADFTFPVEIVVWSLVFFIGGYALYASLMAGAGALVPKMKEAGIANFVAMFPLLFGYMFGIMAPVADATTSTFLVFLSIFPLTSPVVMMMRLVDGIVPIWQIVLSTGLLYMTAYFAQRMVAAMFNAQNLLSGQPFSVPRYFRALMGQT